MTEKNISEGKIDGRVRFINVFSFIFVAVVAGCFYTLYVTYGLERPKWHYYFGIAVASWHLLTGIGLLTRQRWGYYLFKVYLYLLFLSFPIGTIISYKCLKYMKENNVDALFKKG